MRPALPPQDPDIRKLLKDMESLKAEYPADLLAARRAAFLDQVTQHAEMEAEQELSPRDLEIVDLLKRLKSLEGKYPLRLMTARRSSFTRQITWMSWIRWWVTLRSAIQKKFASPANAHSVSPGEWMRTSLVLVSLVVAAYIGFLSYENGDRTSTTALAPVEDSIPQPAPVVVTTSTPEVTRLMCRPGYEPPLCLAAEFRKTPALSDQDNGSARPAVAKDTIPGFGEVHRASYVNDGLYGPGTSWVSNSKDSWIKIDLGEATAINTVTFGRDRLGKFNDRQPGQFVIAVALSDDVYANGIHSNDEVEYIPVYDSEQAGFKGSIPRAETVVAHFNSQVVRYIKITFENEGTAIDEVEAFMVEPPVIAGHPSKTPKERPPVSSSTPTDRPTNTPLPSRTATLDPTNTPLPSQTATLVPTDTPVPTDTATPLPTGTPIPSNTPTPAPTDTPVPTNTPVPTDTAIPAPTDTRVPTITAVPNPATPMTMDLPPGLDNRPRPTNMPGRPISNLD